MQLEYRPALPEDAQTCVALRGKTRENALSEDQLRGIGITAESWADNIASGALPGDVCTCDGNIVGYCFGSSKTGEIEVLIVLPEFENLGIGRELLNRAVKQLSALGHNRVYLGCNPDPKVRSHGFYRHLGWCPTGNLDQYGDEILELHVGET